LKIALKFSLHLDATLIVSRPSTDDFIKREQSISMEPIRLGKERLSMQKAEKN